MKEVNIVTYELKPQSQVLKAIPTTSASSHHLRLFVVVYRDNLKPPPPLKQGVLAMSWGSLDISVADVKPTLPTHPPCFLCFLHPLPSRSTGPLNVFHRQTHRKLYGILHQAKESSI